MSRSVARIAIVCILLLATLWGTAGPVLPAHAATLTVTNCTSDTDFLSKISSAAAGDTVTFSCSGTIHLATQGICGPLCFETDGPIALSKNVTIDGAGQTVTIDASQVSSVFVVNSGATVTLNDLTIADGSGGIENHGTLTVTNSTISGNHTGTSGGAIFNTGTLTVSNSTFSANSADGVGGGIQNYTGGRATVTNSTFSGNSASGPGEGGGGIANLGTMSITNSTFSGNSSANGPGGTIYNGGALTVVNTILANSPSGFDCYNVPGATLPTDGGGNLADDGSCGFTQSSSRNSASGLNLGSLADNGGPTQTIAPGAGSAAIDFASCLQLTDQRGFTRPDAGEAMCDSGALESGSAAPMRVGSCDQTVLESALGAVGSGGTVQFTQDCTITLASTIVLSRSVTLDGNGYKVTLSGGGAVPVLLISSLAGLSVSLRDLTIANGHAAIPSNFGGGISNGATLSVIDSTFSGNSNDIFGGAILNSDTGTLSVTDSTFSGNSGGQAAAILNTGKSVSVTNSTFSGNSAATIVSGGSGTNGVIYTDNGTLSVTNSTFSGNSADAIRSEPIRSSGGTVTLANTILAGSSGGQNCYGSVTDRGGNLSDDGSCGFTQSSSTNSATGLNLGPLADNGGATQTIALGAGSAALGAGLLSVCTAAPVSGVDQRGSPRPDAGDTTCDSGAYEFQPRPDTDLALTNVPANITTDATSAAGAVVTYTAPTAVDEAGDTPAATVSCDHASGATFPVGTTTVTCTATDSDDTNIPVYAQFTVTVNDSDLSLTGVPANITTAATSAAGATVTYTPPTATDEDGAAPAVSCDHASGSTFPLGATTVPCTATDSDDTNSPVSAQFTVSVNNPRPVISSIDPNYAEEGQVGSVTVTGTGFTQASMVYISGLPYPTSFLDSTHLVANVQTFGTSQVTVVNPAPGGGTSNPQVLFVTSNGTPLTGTPGVATGANASATTGGTGPSTPGSVTVSGAGGSGTVATALYANLPTGTAFLGSSNAYFDVYVAPFSFTTVTIVDCNLNGGSQVQFWNGIAWEVASDQTYDSSTGCVTVTVNANTTTPTLPQLSGTPFGVANVPPVVQVPGAQSVPYGGPLSFQVSATDVEAGDKLTLKASGLPAGLSFTDNGDDTGTVSGTVSAPAGTYTARFTANDGYSDAPAGTVQITVTKAPLTITASSPTSTYNGSVPAITPLYSGLANGDQAPATPPICTSTAPSSGAAGTYPTTCAGAADPNYAISYVAGTLTINPAPLTVTASNQQMTYGGTLPALPVSYSGFVNGDTAAALTTQPSCSTVAATSPVGSYTITCTGAVAPNYTISYQTGTLTITPAALTITASSATMLLHGTVPAITPRYSGFVNGDSASSLTPPTCTTTATSSSPVGSYPTTCSGAVDANYSVTYVPGTLAVSYQVKVLSSQTAATKSGAGVPIKLQLRDAQGANLSSAAVAVTLGTPALAPSPSPGAQPSGAFTFLPIGDAGPMYQYNVKSTGYPAATYTLSFTVAGDPVPHTVQFVIG